MRALSLIIPVGQKGDLIGRHFDRVDGMISLETVSQRKLHVSCSPDREQPGGQVSKPRMSFR